MRQLLLLVLVSLTAAEICPIEKHTICNSDYDHLACTCSVSESDDNPVPEVSCNALINRELETLKFPVVSVEFNLDSAEGLEEWPEQEFRETISSSLRVEEDDIVILRAGCQGTDNSLTVQFVIVKKNRNSTVIPFDVDDLIDSASITTRMKAMGHLSQIANLDVDTIEQVDQPIDLEFNPSNLELILKGIAFALIFGVFFVMGIVKLFKKENEYTDDLQKS